MMRHVFISPHMDDAILSAGDWLLKLVAKKEKILIVTVFTNFGKGGPLSLGVRTYLICSGFTKLKDFARQRYKEDIAAMKKLGAPYLHLGFVDAGFRVRNKCGWWGEFLARFGIGLKFYYPLHNEQYLFSGKIAPEDQSLKREIQDRLKKIIKSDDIVYGPLGIGKHADHLIINKIVCGFKNKTYFWLDQPYAHQKKNRGQLKEIKKKFVLAFKPSEKRIKEKLIACYSSQVKCGGESWLKFGKEEFYQLK